MHCGIARSRASQPCAGSQHLSSQQPAQSEGGRFGGAQLRDHGKVTSIKDQDIEPGRLPQAERPAAGSRAAQHSTDMAVNQRRSGRSVVGVLTGAEGACRRGIPESGTTRCAHQPDPSEFALRGVTGDRLMAAKYHEEIHRYPALLDGGRSCEILERITFERDELADGSLGEPRVCNRRFDLRTGERVNALGGDDFELDLEKTRLRRVREG
jgi:hypothetical protein